jgi:AcrR family transcriptional regulator
MARPAGSSGADTMRAIRQAAITRIFHHGYEAMNLRDLAADVHLKIGSLYNYIPQKQEFLAKLLEDILHELLSDLDAQVTPIADPCEKLFAFVRFHIEWHTARRQEVFIGNMELRSLSPEPYQRVIALRKQYETYLQDILKQGGKAGYWNLRDAKVTSYAVLAMLTGVSNWYRRDGRLSQARLIKLYQELVASTIGVSVPEAAPISRRAKRPNPPSQIPH